MPLVGKKRYPYTAGGYRKAAAARLAIKKKKTRKKR